MSKQSCVLAASDPYSTGQPLYTSDGRLIVVPLPPRGWIMPAPPAEPEPPAPPLIKTTRPYLIVRSQPEAQPWLPLVPDPRPPEPVQEELVLLRGELVLLKEGVAKIATDVQQMWSAGPDKKAGRTLELRFFRMLDGMAKAVVKDTNPSALGRMWLRQHPNDGTVDSLRGLARRYKEAVLPLRK